MSDEEDEVEDMVIDSLGPQRIHTRTTTSPVKAGSAARKKGSVAADERRQALKEKMEKLRAQSVVPDEAPFDHYGASTSSSPAFADQPSMPQAQPTNSSAKRKGASC